MRSPERLAVWRKNAGWTAGAIAVPSIADRVVARWELNPFGSRPLAFSCLVMVPLPAATWSLAWFAHSKASAVWAVALLAGWLIVVGLDGARARWVSRHPFASQRWLRAVRVAVGDDVARRAVTWLIRRYGDEPDYRVRRSDMALAVQIGRSEQREATCWAEGVRLHEAALDADPSAAAERRSDTQARGAA
jgi:hypothetical protein